MKRLTLILMVIFSVVSLNAKTLIVYYSFTNNVNTIVRDLQTQIAADVLRVEPAEEGLDYAANNYAIGSALISAIRNNPDDVASYPAIKTTISSLSDYDTIIVAAPLWWSNMAAPLQTFLFNYGGQMAGKSIGLIVSSASSGINGVEADARRLIPNGNFMEPSLWIRSSQTSNCHSMLANWLEETGYNNPTSIAGVNNDADIDIVSRAGLLQIRGAFKSLSMYNISGSKVLQTSDDYINTNSFGSGIYIVSIDKGNQTVIHKKICINN